MSTTHGPVAIVTGGGSGIGTAVARKLSTRGYRIAVVDHHKALCYRTLEAVAAVGGEAWAFPGDIWLVHEAEAVVTRVVETLGVPSVLVNNTDATLEKTDAGGLDPDGIHCWDAVLRVGLRAPYLLSSAVQRHMVLNGWGRIVNVTPPHNGDGCLHNGGFAVAVSGIRGFTSSLAEELAPHGVTVNAVLPGLILNEPEQGAPRPRAKVPAPFPIRRPGTPEDVAESVAFFASEAAGSVTGQALNVAECLTCR